MSTQRAPLISNPDMSSEPLRGGSGYVTLRADDMPPTPGSTFPAAVDIQAEHQDKRHPQFKAVIGEIPFCEPNVRPGHEAEDITKEVELQEEMSCGDTLCALGCCFTGAGCFYVCSKMELIQQGEYGFALNNGRPRILMPGRTVLMNPLNSFISRHNVGDNLIQMGPVTIVRVPQGSYGLAMHNTRPEVLLPGVHVRNNAAFKFASCESQDQDLIQFGPIKFLMVKSGGVRVCYINGRVKNYTEGRYAINSGTFVVGGSINTQQQNLRFEKHPVLLDGGISMLVEGLLTYQVVDVEKLIHQLGDRDLVRAIQDVTKAELARVFAGLHLEQISQASVEPLTLDEEAGPNGLLGKTGAQAQTQEGETRIWICSSVMKYITPITASWGVKVINFQLESTKIADDDYAKEYEAASLAMAKAKANLRAANAQNQIRIQTAAATAETLKIEAEGKRNATVIEAQGAAEARKIDAKARNEAAESMGDQFAKDFAFAGQQVEFAQALAAKVLTVIPSSGPGVQLSLQQAPARILDN